MMNKKLLGKVVLGTLLLACGAAGTVAAANVPNGSYLRSCININVRGDRSSLSADCRKKNGDWIRAFLANPFECTHDITNNDGHLECKR